MVLDCQRLKAEALALDPSDPSRPARLAHADSEEMQLRRTGVLRAVEAGFESYTAWAWQWAETSSPRPE